MRCGELLFKEFYGYFYKPADSSKHSDFVGALTFVQTFFGALTSVQTFVGVHTYLSANIFGSTNLCVIICVSTYLCANIFGKTYLCANICGSTYLRADIMCVMVGPAPVRKKKQQFHLKHLIHLICLLNWFIDRWIEICRWRSLLLSTCIMSSCWQLCYLPAEWENPPQLSRHPTLATHYSLSRYFC